MKTLDDCTREDLTELMEAAIDLYRLAMYYHARLGDEPKFCVEYLVHMRELSCDDPIAQMRAALLRCGLDAPTYEEFFDVLRRKSSIP